MLTFFFYFNLFFAIVAASKGDAAGAWINLGIAFFLYLVDNPSNTQKPKGKDD